MSLVFVISLIEVQILKLNSFRNFSPSKMEEGEDVKRSSLDPTGDLCSQDVARLCCAVSQPHPLCPQKWERVTFTKGWYSAGKDPDAMFDLPLPEFSQCFPDLLFTLNTCEKQFEKLSECQDE